MEGLWLSSQGFCRVHKPRVPRGPASTPGLDPGEQPVAHGPAQKSKKQRVGRIDRSPIGRSTKRTNARSTTSSAHLSDRSARLGRRPPPGGLSDRKAWPKTLLPTPTPRLRPETRRKPAYRSSPTGTASTDWSHPTGDSRSEGTRGKRRKQRTKSKHGTRTIPCTPAGTVLHN